MVTNYGKVPPKRGGAPRLPANDWNIVRGATNDARVVFRRKRERLVLELDGDSWAFEWRGERRPLGIWATIEETDGTAWIIQPPEPKSSGSRSIPHPYRPHPGLDDLLFHGWYGAMQIGARHERAHEKEAANAAMEIIKALQQAIRAGETDGNQFVEDLATRASRYLKRQEFEGLPRLSPKRGQGHRLVLDRTAALQSLANRWWGNLPPDDKTGDEAVALAHEYIRDCRQGSNYAKVAALMPRLPNAGAEEAREISRRYLEACAELWSERRVRLCERCAPGTGALGMNGTTHHAAPSPGDRIDWGCKGTTPTGGVCGSDAVRRLDDDGWEAAKKLVCEAAAVLGYPAKKARHLFSFVEKRFKHQSLGR